MISIIFPDSSVKKFEKGTKVIDVAKSISEGLARKVISASFNKETCELETKLDVDGNIKFYTWEDNEGKQAFWHSSAHILAQTIKFFYPKSKLTIGPSIENGFYYDVDFNGDNISEKDFQKIEAKFLEFARTDSQFIMKSMSKDEALDFYKREDNQYKVELIKGLDDGTITFCDHSNFSDLCRGGHIPSTGIVKAVKLLNIAGAYWRGDEKNNQLTRIYGISFPKQKLLTEYLELVEKAKERDHRKLGKELELFTFSKKVGQGLPLWLPKGTELRDRLQRFLEDAQKKAGYKKVMSPHIGSKELYVTSGHYDKYGEDSFQPILTPNDSEIFMLRPMNCPHHCEIFNSKPLSYRDLPLRLAEFGTVYRYEQSGELHGLSRVRGFTVDDAHIFCAPEQVDSEFKNTIDLVLYVFKSLGFSEFYAQVSLRDPNNPDKYIGSKENWNIAEKAILDAAKETELDCKVEYGEAAFYGPKLDFMVNDALG
ncbi:MAG: threonine--tRNA ligase, partial [Flavobacteriales bacterium]|nr:threonine--tRNA ligase [Flavobacteriales bacterium]